ncbi:MAG TPA: NAD(P)(+) transhydrogenase (Re/Si-specific) subunit alpha, partial [Candidatus Limnocylindria bacterium]|nr:NAD(P)(+) transhydrogenase (Re/Si-specific) subunit alpha [Candidatus Limnocylindria bacterium]
MVIGVPREIMREENRVAATPETCAAFVRAGHTVLMERGAGEGAFFADAQYEAAGVSVVPDAREVYGRADVVLKVKEPQYNEALREHEADLLHKGQVLIAFLHPAAPGNHAMVRRLAHNGVTALTLDGIPRIPRAREMDPLISMSVCAGYKGVLMAVCLLPRFVPGVALQGGTAEPARALVVGAGVAGMQALDTLRRLGARVFAADIREDARERAQNLGAEMVDLSPPSQAGQGADAHEALLEHERAVLARLLPDMDVVVLSQLMLGHQAPVLVTAGMVQSMKPGSVILDISVDQGGNCELTEPGEIVLRHGVHVIGIKNIP